MEVLSTEVKKIDNDVLKITNDRIREIMLKKNFKELTENEIMTEKIWTDDFVKWYYVNGQLQRQL